MNREHVRLGTHTWRGISMTSVVRMLLSPRRLALCVRVVAPRLPHSMAAPSAVHSISRRLICAPAAGASSSGATADASPPPPLEVTGAMAAAGGIFNPSFTRSARRGRLHRALEAARLGEPFVLEPAERREQPGACFAVMTILKESGTPLTSRQLRASVEERYPGLIHSLNHLKRNIMQSALVNHVMKVRHNGSVHKEYWSPRRAGQIRMTIARRAKNRVKTIQHSDPRRDKKGRRVKPHKRWPPRKWFAPMPKKRARVAEAPVHRPLPGQEGYVAG